MSDVDKAQAVLPPNPYPPGFVPQQQPYYAQQAYYPQPTQGYSPPPPGYAPQPQSAQPYPYMQPPQPQSAQPYPYMQPPQPQSAQPYPYMQPPQPQYSVQPGQTAAYPSVQQQQVTTVSQQTFYGGGVQPVQLLGSQLAVALPPGFLPPILPPQMPNLWTSNLCDCADEVGNCLETLFCPYCQLGYLDRKLSSGYSGLDWGTCCMYYCLDTWLTCGLALAWGSSQTRDRIRVRFNIEPQDTCRNCLQGFCCPHLSLCQAYRELSNRGYWPDGMCVNVPPPVTHPMGNPMPIQNVTTLE